MTLTNLKLRPGEPIVDQVVFAAHKSLLAGEYSKGQPFPSVRALATQLRIHPNTAHKVVQELIRQGWLVARHGQGTTVAEPPLPRAAERRRALNEEADRFVVEARRVGASLQEVVQAISRRWQRVSDVGEEGR